MWDQEKTGEFVLRRRNRSVAVMLALIAASGVFARRVEATLVMPAISAGI